MNDDQYLKGNKNWWIRMYFYLSNGLQIVNEFRNLLLGIFGVYITLKLEHPGVMLIMLVVSVMILIPVGHFMVHHVSKVKEWLGTKFGSHYAIKNFDFTEGSYEKLKKVEGILEEILAELKKSK